MKRNLMFHFQKSKNNIYFNFRLFVKTDSITYIYLKVCTKPLITPALFFIDEINIVKL